MTARILIVEDNPANLELMRYLLDASKYVLSTASTAEGGLALAGKERPDLILCDIQLPGMDGYAMMRALRADPALQTIPVVAVTALAMVGDRDKILAAGFDGYLSKPIEPETFVGQVEAWLAPALRNAVRQAHGVAPSPEPPAQPARRRRLLAVDNSWTNLAFVASLFEASGYKVTTAPNVRFGLRLALETQPHVILSDVVMADASGYEFIRRVKSVPALQAIPFVFITSTVHDEAERQRGLALGAAKYLFRPIEPAELFREIEACAGISPFAGD